MKYSFTVFKIVCDIFLFLLVPVNLAVAGGSAKSNNNDVLPVAQSLQTNQTSPNSILPSFLLLNANDSIIDFKNFAGKKVFVNLWATWCLPCRIEMPSIRKLYQAVDTAKVAFVFISFDDTFSKAKKYMQRRKPQLPVYYAAGPLPELFQVQGIPASFVFDEKGTLIQQVEGSVNYNTDYFRQLLK